MSSQTNEALQQRRARITPRAVPSLAPFYVQKALNAEIWDVEGNRYIDFAGGVGVLNTGHLHPKVTAAVQKQLTEVSHVGFAVAGYPGYFDLAEKLAERAPIAGAKKAMFLTTGVEAVENAIKIARVATKRTAVIAFNGAFHGRTMLGMALTGKVYPYKAGFGPFPGDVYHVPFPSHGVSVEASLEALDNLFKVDVEPQRIAAIIVEPVQGEGGFNVAPVEFLQALREICTKHGIIFIADEVQAGFGRTGRWFSIEHSGVEPDLITTAKSLAGGYPLSGVVGRAEIMDAPEPGGLGGTYAGNPLALAAGLAIIDVIETEGLLSRSEELGSKLVKALQEINDVPELAEVRGLGSMLAAEFRVPGKGPTAYDATFAKRVQQEALSRGLILLTCGAGASAVRFLYPLTIEDSVFDEAVHKVVASIRAAA
ncbi:MULTISPECIES: 4-aminobutyrate--2-oxoglutarate transaminase [Agrobacterium]|uniref:4-aminobutyrate--2-oxoglutarate transaminase n=1 Tax=Agrobacterium rubi TaxID=28099 RepID=A0AAE7RAE6_9HYPH|nr:MULTISPECIES: 4-aminobutyrate--2-oxoglutarate transaminase [Agrobacterium]MBN7808940.1 4-aminobutyrate--2-oxoglutarate transaminase [Agrobacterium rosae]NTE89858.1 4-aminobutyrate--2-oxoglutarate transaminase [Agrobacterium rubi]NTF05292.1 4-aminobutyrate--2-oxoglutarate transaminase [Agrobacterium rubi]NTF10534.1 4-aminobutyrate--2-oxoglutarate transaminase [Agrobacterium rubi]NTF22928.1 4-aminobutyrate--2-oxoglutarate transaminase [Agrobacterium rubi]